MERNLTEIEYQRGRQFNCGRCVFQEKDVQAGCPRCELTIQTNFFKKYVREEVLKRWGIGWGSMAARTWPFQINLERGLEIHREILSMLAANKCNINPGWLETDAALARVVLDEHNRALQQEANDRRAEIEAGRK
jgi:hypothetical protein